MILYFSYLCTLRATRRCIRTSNGHIRPMREGSTMHLSQALHKSRLSPCFFCPVILVLDEWIQAHDYCKLATHVTKLTDRTIQRARTRSVHGGILQSTEELYAPIPRRLLPARARSLAGVFAGRFAAAHARCMEIALRTRTGFDLVNAFLFFCHLMKIVTIICSNGNEASIAALRESRLLS